MNRAARMNRRALSGLASALAVPLVLAGCTHSSGTPGTDTTITQTVTGTRTSAAPGKALTLTAVAPLPPGQSPPKGETEKLCPYIRTGINQDPTTEPNVADIEGDRIYRTTVLTTMKPVGCRFYFYSGPFEPTADILTFHYASHVEANNVLALTTRGDHEASTHNLGAGLTGVTFRSHLDAEDNGDDWACGFAKGTVLYIVRTRQNVSLDALDLATAIAGKVPSS